MEYLRYFVILQCMTPIRNGGWWAQIPPVTKNLIIINVVVWLLEVLLPASAGNWLVDHGGLHFWGGSDFNPIQLVSYMFLHSPSSILHLLFNMFTLWMFGRILEQTWGAKRFLLFYFVCGIGGALTQEIVWNLTWFNDYVSGIAPLNGLTESHMAQTVREAMEHGDPNFLSAVNSYKNSLLTVGASGAIFGLLLGFACTFPDLPLYLFFIPVPIKAKYMVVGYAVLEFFLGVSGNQSTVAHFAHLGGLVFGLGLILWWRHGGKLRSNGGFASSQRLRQAFNGQRREAGPDYSSSLNTDRYEARRRLNELLDKIRLSGYASLTQAERDELRRLSEKDL